MATTPIPTITVFEITLQPMNQTLNITLVGVEYTLTVIWNARWGYWMLTIALASGEVLVSNLAMVTGVDLLQQFGYLGIGGRMVVQTDNNPLVDPTFDNLGVTSHLYFIPDSQ